MWMRESGYAFFDRVADAFGREKRSGRAEYDSLNEERLLHQQALLDMGFLAKRKVPTGRTNAWAVVSHMWRPREAIEGYAHGEVRRAGRTNYFVVITAPLNDLPKWVEFVKTLVPEA